MWLRIWWGPSLWYGHFPVRRWHPVRPGWLPAYYCRLDTWWKISVDKTKNKRRAYSVQPVNFYCGRESWYFGNRLNSKARTPPPPHTHTHTYARIHIHTPHAHTHARSCAYIHAHMIRTLTHVHAYNYIHVRTHILTHARIHTHMHIHSGAHTYHAYTVSTFGGYLATAEYDTGLTLLWALTYSRPKAANLCLKTHVGVFAESTVT